MCPICDDGRCLACLAGGHVRELAETSPAHREIIRAKWEAAKAAPPGLIRAAANFLSAAARHVAHGMPTVSDDEKARRLAICGACDHFEPEKSHCKICSCWMDMKASWEDMQCPDKPPRW